MITTVECRRCQRTATKPEPAEGHPYGWYAVTVNTPPDLGHRGKPYRWVGTFCSIGCLMAHEQVLIKQAEEMRGLYDRE